MLLCDISRGNSRGNSDGGTRDAVWFFMGYLDGVGEDDGGMGGWRMSQVVW